MANFTKKAVRDSFVKLLNEKPLSQIIMVLFGIVKILGYCSKDLYRLAFQHDPELGTLLVILGAVMIFRTAPVISV